MVLRGLLVLVGAIALLGCYVPWAGEVGPVVVAVAPKGDVLLVKTCKIWINSDSGAKLTECEVKPVDKIDED